MTRVILSEVKTAVSIPDDLFERAEAAAQRSGLPRSRLYAAALAEYLERHSGEWVTKALDRVHAHTPVRVDHGLARAQAQAIDVEDW